MNALFGGFELDLTGCRIPDEQATVTVFIAFGGGDIRVPRDWNVEVRAFAIFGGTDDKSAHPAPEGDVPPKKLVIFLNAFSLTASDRAAIRARLAADQSTALWFYAPGVLGPDATDAAAQPAPPKSIRKALLNPAARRSKRAIRRWNETSSGCSEEKKRPH